MESFYGIVISAYGLFIRLAAFIHPKAAEWVKGRADWRSEMRSRLKNDELRIWMHCSSLGEYEQGRPVLERLRSEYKNHKIVLTFFSPSGYNQKKNDPLADYVFYLPLDSRENSLDFIQLIQPSFAVFVKYEFWHFYIKTLKDLKIPSFVISALFRENQIYFKSYGKFFYQILQRITHLFVQNQQSLELLYDNKLPNVTVSGDTRFDRVYSNSMQHREIPFISEFRNKSPLFIAGSTWQQDEKVLVPLIYKFRNNLKFIIVPHEIESHSIQRLKKQIGGNVLLYSELSSEKVLQCDVLIIDNVGMLSSLYRYAEFAFVGGGFGSGIHNTLEAAVFGLPVFFGPNYKKFREAIQLTEMKTAFSVRTTEELSVKLEELMNNRELLQDIKDRNRRFIESSKGATEVIMNYLRMNYPSGN